MNLRNFTIKAALTLAIAAGTLAAVADVTPATKRHGRRRASPVNTQATTTQSINETRDDTARINAAIRARSSHFHREDGAVVYVDTITGEQWIDSAAIRKVPRMKYPLLTAVNAGVDIWDPIMRVFGQKYGIAGLAFDLSLHNRYFPTFEIGLGTARRTPTGNDYTYRSPLSVYFKIGANYNFLYNSNPDYQFFAGLRYGFSPFAWAIDNVTLSGDYWDETVKFDIPSQHSTAGWGEFVLGLRIRLGGNIHAGWLVRYHMLLHESKNAHGKPWYIPGYGARGQAITGSFTISYTLPLKNKNILVDLPPAPDDERPDTLIAHGDTIIGPGLVIE